MLAGVGLARRSAGGIALGALGAMLLLRGLSGRCMLYRALGIDTAHFSGVAGVGGGRGIRVEKTVRVRRSPGDVYNFWRHLENLPRFMPHVEAVRDTGDGHSHWVVKGPAGSRVEWDAEIINDRPGEILSWQSLPGAEVENAGSVWFRGTDGGMETDVKVALLYQPPAGRVGASLARILGDAPEQQLDQDLARFKELVEASAGGVSGESRS